MPNAANVFRLGVKELWSLARDPIMSLLICWTFSFGVYLAATAMPETLNKAPIAVVDEDGSPLSARLVGAFYPPHFLMPELITLARVDPGMDAGDYTFVLDIPPDFQRDVLAGRPAKLQLNVDATRMSQAFTGSAYVQQMALGEVDEFVRRFRGRAGPRVDLALRARFNPNLEQVWFGALAEMVNNVTMLAIILTGAALIREREHGTVEHLLAMPVTPAEIMFAKLWSMGLVVLAAVSFSLVFVVQGVLRVPIHGSQLLFLSGAALDIFAATSMGIFLGTLARSMPQFGMLVVLVLIPLEVLSGATTPRESMPALVRNLMLAAPSTHFVALSQAVLFRGAGLGVVWPHFAALAAIGGAFFAVSLNRFRRTIGLMA